MIYKKLIQLISRLYIICLLLKLVLLYNSLRFIHNVFSYKILNYGMVSVFFMIDTVALNTLKKLLLALLRFHQNSKKQTKFISDQVLFINNSRNFLRVWTYVYSLIIFNNRHLLPFFKLYYTFSCMQCFRYILTSPPKPLSEIDIWFQIGHVYEQQKEVSWFFNFFKLS